VRMTPIIRKHFIGFSPRQSQILMFALEVMVASWKRFRAGAKMVGAMTYGVTAEFSRRARTRGSTEKFAWMTGNSGLFELIRIGDGFVACKGGNGHACGDCGGLGNVEQGRDYGKPFVVLGDFWEPILERVREVELGHASSWGEANGKLAHSVATPTEAAEFLRRALME